ncbi:MAG: hypothetical protein LBJ00_07995 [Planctomycetaceae bacterium]|jgi:rhodanese-related sulfurtransferase|nr:hypothetical protein [Planctomycetaceae bacterium]
MLRIFPVTVFFLAFFVPLFANEKKTDDSLPDLKNIIVAGPYCGVYSLVTCLDAFGKMYSIQELLQPEYIGSFRGSTNNELIKAANKYGLYGKCYANMAWWQLKDIREPMILHFRGTGDSEFNHWVAFLGMEGNHVRVVDAPHEIAHLTMAELLANWDGMVILLSKNPIQDEHVWQSRFEYLFIVFFTIATISLYKRYFGSKNSESLSTSACWQYRRKVLVKTILLLGVCSFVAVVYHALCPIGFLKNPSAVAEVTRRYHAVDVPEITVGDMRQISKQKSAIIYDARYHVDFEQGSIPGAVSLPINSNLSERKQLLQGVSKTQKIVIYCQSSGCGFSDDIASFLKFNGYCNVSIFRGGYREWTVVQQRP